MLNLYQSIIMFKAHPDLQNPDPTQSIWHYFSLPKFFGLLNSSSLYFCRSDKYDDLSEGSLTQKDKEYFSKYSFDSNRINGDGLGCVYSNCWTRSEHDEYVLWKSYASLTDGIAIKTTVKRLIESLDQDDLRQVYASNVQYINYETEYSFTMTNGFIVLLAPHFTKRKYFEAEKEFRLLYWDNKGKFTTSPNGLLFKVNLETLLESVYVSPFCYVWFKDAISDLLNKYSLRCPVVSSNI